MFIYVNHTVVAGGAIFIHRTTAETNKISIHNLFHLIDLLFFSRVVVIKYNWNNVNAYSVSASFKQVTLLGHNVLGPVEG